MPTKFLAYWVVETSDRMFDQGESINHIAGQQLHRASPGDTIFICTSKSGRLYMVGRIIVPKVTDRAEAEALLGTDDLWNADYHVIAKDGTESIVQPIDLTSMAEELRFISSTGRDRLLETISSHQPV